MSSTERPSGGLARIPFSADEERLIESTSRWVMIAGVVTLVSGVASAAFVLLHIDGPAGLSSVIGCASSVMGLSAVPEALAGLGAVAMGIWLLRAAAALRRVAISDEDDQASLVRGLSRLRAVFLAKAVVIVCAIVLLAVVSLMAYGSTPQSPLGVGMPGPP